VAPSALESGVRVILFGATGMVGQGVLRECLLDADVQGVLSIGRSATGQSHPKLTEIVHKDLLDLSSIKPALSGFDACFFCLGVASAGMAEADYRRVTFDIAVGAAQTLVRLNPGMAFVYISGAGADSSEHGRSMWARVRGQTENAILRLPFKTAAIIRPAGIIPLHGITSRTPLYRVAYALTRPLWPVLYRAFPQFVTTTEQLGRGMLRIARRGASKPILEARDINGL
jgi:uncharacterized protein YbjT (DUF2867 family)